MTLHVGFTGTRYDVTPEQWKVLDTKLGDLLETSTDQPVLHHGACVGADTSAHLLAWRRGYKVVLHPPSNRKLRSWVERTEFWNDATDVVLPEKEYLARNVDIVACSAVLLGTPDGEPRTLSGTWHTIRAAGRMGVQTIVIMPDGEIRG